MLLIKAHDLISIWPHLIEKGTQPVYDLILLSCIKFCLFLLSADRKALFNGFAHHPYAMGPLPFMPFNNHMLSPPVSLAMASHLGLRPDGSMLKDRSSSESDIISPR
jgi:hypothetical protein